MSVLRWLLFLGFCLSHAMASSLTAPQSTVYQMIWQPQLHGERLNYCNEEKSGCGEEIANQYCHLLGFEKSKRFQQAKHIGLTHFISGKNQCQGWKCSGFDWIECIGHRTYIARPLSDYQHELFVRPRWRKFPLAWCYDATEKECGKKSAYAFCRWQGYSNVARYTWRKNVYASKQIGTNGLCFGPKCKGFEYIVCKRS